MRSSWQNFVLISTGTLLFFCAGCEWCLPPGEPPPGTIVDNPAAENNRVQTMTYDTAVTAFANELTNVLLMYCHGSKLFADADNHTVAGVNEILKRSAVLSGISPASSAAGVPQLTSRFDLKNTLWQIRLTLPDGEEVYSRTIKLVAFQTE